MKIAITGGTGLLGSNFQRLYPQHEYRIFSGRIESLGDVEKFCEDIIGYDCFLHLAAVVPRYKVETNPSLAVNVNSNGTENVLRALGKLKNRAPWIFYASTSHVYSSSVTAIKEEGSTIPFSTYGQTKLLGEAHAFRYMAEHDLKITIGRIFSYSNKNQSDEYFMPAMFKLISESEKNQKIAIPGLHGIRDFLRIGQVCKAIHELAEMQFTGAINIGTGSPTLLSDLVNMIAKKLNRGDLELIALPNEFTSHFADLTKMKSLSLEIESQLDNLLDEVASKYA